MCVYVSQKQMTYLETQQDDVQTVKEEVRRLKVKMKTFERYWVSAGHLIMLLIKIFLNIFCLFLFFKYSGYTE